MNLHECIDLTYQFVELSFHVFVKSITVEKYNCK